MTNDVCQINNEAIYVYYFTTLSINSDCLPLNDMTVNTDWEKFGGKKPCLVLPELA